jgi:hypothetical protein
MEAAEDLRETAIKQIKKRRDFRSHLVIYLLVNLLLWGSWGVGLLINAWDTYGTSPITEQEVQAEIERLKERT